MIRGFDIALINSSNQVYKISSLSTLLTCISQRRGWSEEALLSPVVLPHVSCYVFLQAPSCPSLPRLECAQTGRILSPHRIVNSVTRHSKRIYVTRHVHIAHSNAVLLYAYRGLHCEYLRSPLDLTPGRH